MADIKKIVYLQVEFYLDQLASKHFQARMLKRYTHREQQLCSVLKIA